MENLKQIINALDKELKESNRPFLTLQQANSVLRTKKIFSYQDLQNNTLKNLLEANKIPNASQTKHKPKQWRIFPSKVSKPSSSQKNINAEQIKPKTSSVQGAKQNNPTEFVCPNCNSAIKLPILYASYFTHDEILTCRWCKKPYYYPSLKRAPDQMSSNAYSGSPQVYDHSTSESRKSSNLKYFLIASIILNVIFVIRFISDDDSHATQEMLSKQQYENTILEPESEDINDLSNNLEAEQLYIKLKDSYNISDYDTFKNLFNEFKSRHVSSNLFDELNVLMNKIIEIESVEKEKARITKKEVQAYLKDIDFQGITRQNLSKQRYLTVFAEMYPDNILSCNIYLNDPKGNAHSFKPGRIEYRIYSLNGSRLVASRYFIISRSMHEIYHDISFESTHSAQSVGYIEFDYISDSEGIFKSKKVRIDRAY